MISIVIIEIFQLLPGLNPISVVVGDFNNDNRLDLAIANSSDNIQDKDEPKSFSKLHKSSIQFKLRKYSLF